jgi:hypothetical protein
LREMCTFRARDSRCSGKRNHAQRMQHNASINLQRSMGQRRESQHERVPVNGSTGSESDTSQACDRVQHGRRRCPGNALNIVPVKNPYGDSILGLIVII